MQKKLVLSVKDLTISFKTNAGLVHALRGVDLKIYQGETVALVGESGSGKSVTARAVMGILSKNAAIESGSIDFIHDNGSTEETYNILQLKQSYIREHINGKRIAMVFQDPMTSLDPTMTIGNQIMEGMRHHFKTSKSEAYQKAVELLKEVDIVQAEACMKRYPHQLSGGMRQRVVIAIALACNPEILICDEPTTALDVTVQAHILALLKRIQAERHFSILFITHNLGVVAKVADYINVMYAGKIIESGTAQDIFFEPRHPYTWGLLSAIPDISTVDERLYAIPGSPPNMLEKIHGDAFAPRNQYALNIDWETAPPLFQISKTHYAATWLLDEHAPKIDLPETLKVRIAAMHEEALQNAR